MSKVYELILQQQIFHGLSSVCKSAGVKSSIIILIFTPAWSEQESIKGEIADILTGDK